MTPVPDVYSTVVLCLCNMRGFRRNEYNRTPQSSAYAIDNADMSIMLPREKAGRRQIAVVPEKLTSWAAYKFGWRGEGRLRKETNLVFVW